MKTFKTVLLAFLMITVLICCNDKKPDQPENAGGNTTTRVWDDECDNTLRSKPLNQLIVRIDPCAKKIPWDTIKNGVKKIKDKWQYNEIETCPCDSTLILLESDSPNPNPEERLADANDKLKTEGDNIPFGSATYNFDLVVDNPGDINMNEISKYRIPTASVNSQTIVAVIDGGILWEELGLDPYRWISLDTTYYKERLNLTSHNSIDNYHGTIVSHILVNDLNPNKIKLMDLRIFDNDSKGSLFKAACAMSFAIKNNAHIINTSWGYYSDLKKNPTYVSLIEEAKLRNIIVVSSGGNNGSNNDRCPHYPSNLDNNNPNAFPYCSNVLGVAFLNKFKTDLHEKSNEGKKTLSLAAVGRLELSTSDSIIGSSYAAPRVSRTMAILRGNNVGVDCEVLINHLLSHNVDTLQTLKQKLISEGKLKDNINFQLSFPN